MYRILETTLDGGREQVHECSTLAGAVLWSLRHAYYISDDHGKRYEFPQIIKIAP